MSDQKRQLLINNAFKRCYNLESLSQNQVIDVCKNVNSTKNSNLKPSITYSTWWPTNLPRIFLIFTQIVIMYLCFFQPPHSLNTISSHLNLIFSFSKNLKQCFLWKITHKCKSYFYPLGLKQVLLFHYYRDHL